MTYSPSLPHGDVDEQPEPTPTRCGCVQRMNDALRETYPGVRVLADIRTRKVAVGVVRITGKGSTPVLFATFCPFCGVRYED